MTYLAPTYFGALSLYGVSGLVDAGAGAGQIAPTRRKRFRSARRVASAPVKPRMNRGR